MAGSLASQSSGTGNAAFAQQGTVDWTAFYASTFTFSVEMLSRFSKAGVEMITCAMGQAVGSQFNVPPEGEKRVTDAISKLKAYSSYGKVLWFGFGVKHIVRSLCEIKQGTICAALCACLRVSYSTEMSARVMSVLCDQLLSSKGVSPALPQWAALIDVCSGALSPSKFPVMVDGFCRLALANPRPRYGQYKATTVDALAQALAELSKVSKGSVSSITFEGGYDCGWIAAVAEWLLCLKVKVLTEEGSCLYWQDTNESAQVIILFKTSTCDLTIDEIMQLRVVNRSFCLPSNENVDYFRRSGGDVGEPFGMGRSTWSTILEDTFGSAFKVLLSPNIIELFAKKLLSDVMASGSEYPMVSSYNPWEVIHPWMGSFSRPAANRERAFFLTVASRLPELSPLLEALDQLERSAGAAAGPEGSELWDFCNCDLCKPNRLNEPAHVPPGQVSHEICLHHLGLTLIALIWLLARINVDETLQPAPTGLLMLYDYVEDHGFENLNRNLCKNISWDVDLNTTYQRTFELFTGLPSQKAVYKLGATSAICRGGICICFSTLENPLYDPLKQIRLRVIPGRVSFRDRLYTEIVDMEESEPPDSVPSVMRLIAAHGTRRVSMFMVRETFDASQLEAWIALRSGKSSSAFNTYLDHHGVERPRSLPSELGLQIRKVYGNLHRTIYHGTCEFNRGRARSQGLPRPDLTTWERPCPSLALVLESPAPPKRSYDYPEAGEWVVVTRENGIPAPTIRLFRGDFTLLYSIIGLSEGSAAAYLSLFDGCIRCLASSFATREGLPVGKCQIEIHTITEKECTYWSAKLEGILPRRNE